MAEPADLLRTFFVVHVPLSTTRTGWDISSTQSGALGNSAGSFVSMTVACPQTVAPGDVSYL